MIGWVLYVALLVTMWPLDLWRFGLAVVLVTLYGAAEKAR
jgi:hypothetical protein